MGGGSSWIFEFRFSKAWRRVAGNFEGGWRVELDFRISIFEGAASGGREFRRMCAGWLGFSKGVRGVAGIFEGGCGVLGISYSLRLTGYREQSIMAVIAKSMK